jgi:hypothetical protein
LYILIQWKLFKQNLMGTNFCVWFLQVKLTKMSYIGTLYQVQYIQDSCLFMVQLRQVSLQIAENMNTSSVMKKDMLTLFLHNNLYIDTLTLFLHSNLYIIVVFKYSYTAKFICVKGERTNGFKVSFQMGFSSMLCDSEWYYFIYNVENLIQNGIILFIML